MRYFRPMPPALVFAAADGGSGITAPQIVAEIVTFRLNAGITDQAFLQAAAQTRTFLSESGSVLRRTLSKDESDLWTEHIEWASMDIAKSTAEAAMQHPDFAPMMSMIDPETVELRHAPVLMQMD